MPQGADERVLTPRCIRGSLTIPVRGQTYYLRTVHIRDSAAKFVAVLPIDADRPFSIHIEQTQPKRSLEQNAYLWGAVYRAIAETTGYSTDEIHELMKRKFLPASVVQMGDEIHEVPGSTRKLTVQQFGEFIDRVCVFAAELGVLVPVDER